METKLALFSGGASGMAQRGVMVAPLEQTAALSDKRIPWPCAVTNLEQVTAVINPVAESLGPNNRQVHCAAMMPTAPLPEQDIKLIQRMMSVHYGATVNICKTRLLRMRQRGCSAR